MRLKLTIKRNKSRVREIIKFCESQLDRIDGLELHIKQSQYPYRGRALYTHSCSFSKLSKTSKIMATVAIGDDKKFPVQPFKHSPYRLDCSLNNWEEALVFCASHEMFHCLQHQNKWKLSEAKAESHANFTLKQWKPHMENGNDADRNT